MVATAYFKGKKLGVIDVGNVDSFCELVEIAQLEVRGGSNLIPIVIH